MEKHNPKEQYTDWKAPDSKKRDGFSASSEQEQIARTMQLRELFKSNSLYKDYWDNIYKYPDQFRIAGQTTEQVARTFEEARRGVEQLEKILDAFVQIKLKETGQNNNAELYLASLDFAIDPKKLRVLFEWSLKAFIKGGEKIGRTVTVTDHEVEDYVSDMDYIIHKVKDYQPIKK